MLDVSVAMDELDRIEAELAKRSLKVFVQKTWGFIEFDRPLSWNWHLDELCLVLESITRGDESAPQRVIINEPPGTMKSLLISVFWPAWEWASNPALRYINASYGSHLTIRDNLRVKDIVLSEWYQTHYGLSFSGDQNAKERFDTVDGGWRIATSVGGVGLGEHPDRIIIDDPITASDARSKIMLQTVNDWYDRTVSTRGVTRKTVIILVMQRLDANDLSGHLLEKSGWTHICWPMRYEPSRPKTDRDPGHTADPRDHRTKAGELFWPSLFTEAIVRQLEIDLGPYGTAGQLQQRPSPEGGGLFKREWFKFVDAAPTKARRVRGWDTAGTELDGDYTVGVKISEPPGPPDPITGELVGAGLFYIEDVRRGQWSPAQVDAEMKAAAIYDGPTCAQREEKEGGASGKAVVDARAKMLKGHDYVFVQVSGDKITRAKPLRAQCEAGNVYLVKDNGTGGTEGKGWNEDFIRELCAFPTGKNDDQVDGASCSFNAVLLEPIPQDEFVTW